MVDCPRNAMDDEEAGEVPLWCWMLGDEIPR